MITTHGIFYAIGNGRNVDLFAARTCISEKILITVGTFFSQRGMQFDKHDCELFYWSCTVIGMFIKFFLLVASFSTDDVV